MERRELRRDLLLLREGEPALAESVLGERPGAAAELEAARASLAGVRFANLIADRDGSLVPYHVRYRASLQSLWGALLSTRFARSCSGRAVILSAGPLESPGLFDLAVAPARDWVYAASTGREWRDAGGLPWRLPLAPELEQRLALLGQRLESLLDAPRWRRFARLGSGLQRKHGSFSVARQDVSRSVPEPESLALLEALRRLSGELEAPLEEQRRWLELIDTGLDVELHLVQSSAARAFDKGDGVRLLAERLPLALAAGACLVCGDTLADLSMLAAAAEQAGELRAGFVVRPEHPGSAALRDGVRSLDPGAVLLRRPEELLLLLGALAPG